MWVIVAILVVVAIYFVTTTFQTMCAEDAMVCDDGTLVTRVGSGCEFEECPPVGTCSEESRNADACVEIYQPVCADVKVECVTEPCHPAEETFSNSCEACKDERVNFYVDGDC